MTGRGGEAWAWDRDAFGFLLCVALLAATPAVGDAYQALLREAWTGAVPAFAAAEEATPWVEFPSPPDGTPGGLLAPSWALVFGLLAVRQARRTVRRARAFPRVSDEGGPEDDPEDRTPR